MTQVSPAIKWAVDSGANPFKEMEFAFFIAYYPSIVEPHIIRHRFHAFLQQEERLRHMRKLLHTLGHAFIGQELEIPSIRRELELSLQGGGRTPFTCVHDAAFYN